MGSNAEEMIATGNYGKPENMVECKKSGRNEAEVAVKGGTYNKTTKVFIDRKPHNSWVLDEVKGKWEAPKAIPSDGNEKAWNENRVDWENIIVEGVIEKVK